MRFAAAILAAALVAFPVFASDEILVDRTMDFFVVVNEPGKLEVTTELCDSPEQTLRTKPSVEMYGSDTRSA